MSAALDRMADGNMTPPSELSSSIEDPVWVCSICLDHSPTGDVLEAQLVLEETCIICDADGIEWMYCVVYHNAYHVE